MSNYRRNDTDIWPRSNSANEEAPARSRIELLSRAEAAAYLGVKPQTLAVWASARRYGLPMVKVGRLAKYRRSDLDAFIALRTIGGQTDSV